MCDVNSHNDRATKAGQVSLPSGNRWQNGGIIIVCENTFVHGSVSVPTPLLSNIFTTVRFEHRLLPQPTVSIARVDVNGISATNVIEV